MNGHLSIWKIALPVPMKQDFDYLPCDTSTPKAGCRVKVPFGKRNLIGIFLEAVSQTHIETDKLKTAQAVLDEKPLLDNTLLSLCHWASDYYHYPLGDILVSTLPKALRQGKPLALTLLKEKRPVTEKPIPLNRNQQQALESILANTHFAVSLLAGVTGSGKTEVYLQAIASVLQQHKTALVLVPEINLTPQTVKRFEKRFNVPVVALHSGLTDVKRLKAWSQIYDGHASIVIGTRSAIFAPLEKLGMIIVDEEHDVSFKSQKQLRYSARDLAIVRARLENIPVVLGSATPSLETYHNALRGRYQLLSLPNRAGDAQLPEIKLVNLCQQKMRAGMSTVLIKAIKQQLHQNKQVLLFLNRRGYSPSLICHDCGYMIECRRCDAKMTLHKNPERLICHHCDTTIKPPRICPQCQQTDLMGVGQGTEQVEQMLCQLFPEHQVLRIDRDTTTTQKKLSEKLDKINSGEAHILVGTQMLAKGHHFPHLGLSAILDVDSGFFSLDFRAIERLAQLIVQVSGRAGRGNLAGQVILQTYQPQHPHLQLLLKHGYFALMKTLLKERRSGLLPPFSFQAVIWAQAGKQQLPIDFLQSLKQLCEKEKLKVFGPIPAVLERRAGQFRHLLILQSSSRTLLKDCLQVLRDYLDINKPARLVRWAIDVDPLQTC